MLACPMCQAKLELSTSESGEEIVQGELRCLSCGQVFPITGGIPRLLPPELSREKQRTARAFGWEWKHFVEMHDAYEEQFLDWLWPLERDYFKDKVVLDAGCGIGRHAFFAAEYGARDVIGMDLSAAVETAYQNVGHLPNAHVIQADIYNPPFRRDGPGGLFDFIYSIGVLHHLPDPRGGFDSLLRLVRPQGSIFAWVYGYEDNALVHNVITPVRRLLTSRLPPGVVAKIAWPPAVLLQALVRGVYRPLRGRRVFQLLPMRDYLYSVSFYTFRQNYSIVFDHLIPPTAFYLRREEFEAWFTEAELAEVEISRRNRNSWRGRGTVSSATAETGDGSPPPALPEGSSSPPPRQHR
jgi:SAM-dependent methyltransferase